MSKKDKEIEIEVYVSTGKVGSRSVDTFTVPADLSDEEINELAKDAMFNMISWDWKRVP